MLPAAHEAQAPEQAALVRPAPAPYVPAGQRAQTFAPAGDHVPGAQGAHTLTPGPAATLAVPAAHCKQTGAAGNHAQLLSARLLARVPAAPEAPAAHAKR